MDIITKRRITELVEQSEGLCVSIYMQTYPNGKEVEQNPIRLKNQIQKIEENLSEIGKGANEIEEFLSPMIDLVDDEIFWQDQSEGLALFLDSNALHIFQLNQSFKTLSVIGPAYHIKPLILFFQENGQFFLLSLDKNRPRLFQGSKNKLFKVEGLALPKSLEDIFDEYYEINRHLQFHTKTQNPTPEQAGAREGIHFGHGAGEIDQEAEIRNYFHRFDDALMEYFDAKDIPLVLGGVPYLHPLYREANSYPHLLEKGIEKDVSQLTNDELHQAAWEIVKEKYKIDVDQALSVYKQLSAGDSDTSQNLQTIVAASNFKRVHTLFVAENHQIMGYYDPDQNHAILDDKNITNTEDLLNFAARKTLQYNGNVLVLPEGEIPGKNSIAAILRY